jgi:hypothetical protein
VEYFVLLFEYTFETADNPMLRPSSTKVAEEEAVALSLSNFAACYPWFGFG